MRSKGLQLLGLAVVMHVMACSSDVNSNPPASGFAPGSAAGASAGSPLPAQAMSGASRGVSGSSAPNAITPPVMTPPATTPPAMTPPVMTPPATTPPAGTPDPMGGGTTATGPKEPRIPDAAGDCPTLATGMVQIMGHSVQLWVGEKQEEKKAPIMFYWHGTGSASSMAAGDLGPAVAEITADGGLVASFTDTTMEGMNTGNNVWYTGDFEMADQLVACAVKQLNIDTHRIYTGGCSAGGLQASAMVYQRSSYLAAASTNSGGLITQYPDLYVLEDPDHVPALITTHGAPGQDVVVIDFSETSAANVKDIAAKGGFAVNCNHGGGHCGSPATVKAAQWEFMKDHPFGVDPEPYASGLPSDFPAFCEIAK
jgi:predicted esterase